MVELAGLPVTDYDAVKLMILLYEANHDDTATKIAETIAWGKTAVSLRIVDRERILEVLDDPPDELAQLRSILASEHRWRTAHGLV